MHGSCTHVMYKHHVNLFSFMQSPATHLQIPLGPAVVTPAGPKTTLSGVIVHVLPQDYLPALLKCALHSRLGARFKMVLIVAVIPFPAASLIWTGYMEYVQFPGGSFVWKELHI